MRATVLAVSIGFLLACTSPRSVPDPKRETQVRDAAVRYLLGRLATLPEPRPSTVCLLFDESREPPAEFLRRFGREPTVMSMSRCREENAFVWIDTPGLVREPFNRVSVGPVRWLGGSEARVRLSGFWGRGTLRVSLRSGTWVGELEGSWREEPDAV